VCEHMCVVVDWCVSACVLDFIGVRVHWSLLVCVCVCWSLWVF